MEEGRRERGRAHWVVVGDAFLQQVRNDHIFSPRRGITRPAQEHCTTAQQAHLTPHTYIQELDPPTIILARQGISCFSFKCMVLLLPDTEQ